jgi:hypothetical protein
LYNDWQILLTFFSILLWNTSVPFSYNYREPIQKQCQMG